jgi:hypothetical protein
MTAATTSLGNSRADAAKTGLSIIVPVYNEGSGLAALHERIAEAARELRRTHGLGCEVVYVDDGSSDDSLAVAHRLPADGIDTQVVSLSRNFGKEAALMAGLDHARRGAVLFMDADGQHPPALIGTLIGHWLDEGYDVVYTAKANRANESALRRLGGKSFYTLINWGARQKIPEDAGDGGAAPAARAQPLLQGSRDLDRVPPASGRLRAGRAPARRHPLELCEPARPFCRRTDILLGRAAAGREPARHAARGQRAAVRPVDGDRGRRL